MKCAICKNEIETTFLSKIKGIYIKVDGKIYPICRKCQKRLNNDKNLMEKEVKRNL